jgi:hypothetical protein
MKAPSRTILRWAVVGLSAWLTATVCKPVWAFTATLNPASPLTVYLQVGVGSFTNDYVLGGQPQNNSTVNTVAVAVASTALGNAIAQAMSTNSTAARSFWDGFNYCSVPGQLYIGGFYRTTGASTALAQVTATVPAVLTDTAGDTLPFSRIHWTSSGNADTGTEAFPAASFTGGGVQNVGSMRGNTWNESCWSFAYLNNTVPPAGTYIGVVLYTLSAP